MKGPMRLVRAEKIPEYKNLFIRLETQDWMHI